MCNNQIQQWEKLMADVRKQVQLGIFDVFLCKSGIGGDSLNGIWERPDDYDCDYIQAGEWELLQDVFTEQEYEKLLCQSAMLEVWSYRIPVERNIVFYMIPNMTDDFQTVYGFVDMTNREEPFIQFYKAARREDEAGWFVIGTEHNYQEQMERLKDDVPPKVLELLYKRVLIYDEAYGPDRKLDKDLGGFCVVITDQERGTEIYKKAFSVYGLQEGLYEYRDRIEDDGVVWIEELYLISSDYGIILFYSENQNKED